MSTLYTFDARDAVATRCVDTDASQKYANWNLLITSTSMTRPASGWRWRFIGRPTSIVPSDRVFSTAGDILTDKRSCLSTDDAEKRLILIENLLKF